MSFDDSASVVETHAHVLSLDAVLELANNGFQNVCIPS